MDKELQQYYDARFDMFASKGWNDLLEDIDKMEVNLRDILNCSDEKNLHFRKGQLDIILWLKGLKTMSEDAYDGIVAEERMKTIDTARSIEVDDL